jgi:4-methylaminobutanoate oxidase (formaldehyde-forming)
VLGLHYAVPWPNRELESARPQRRSPLHDRLASAGALFGTKMGWERPNVFGPPGATLDYSWDKPAWLPWSAAEQRATRTDVAVFDQTSFSKYVVSGAEALARLQWICANDVDVRLGGCVYTPFLNSRGTYEADLTVTRTGPEEFLLVSSSATTVRDLDWLARHGASARDVTEDYAVLGVMGPRARSLLSTLSDEGEDWSEDGFPFATSRLVSVAGVSLRATRMTYVGELGWELMVPVGDARVVYDAVHGAGAVDAGYYAIESLRLEKGYRAFGRELTPDFGPVEAGLVFATALSGDKDFLGREALERHRASLAAGGPRRRLVWFVVGSPDPMLWGGELILRDGSPAGQVTSAAWGETVGACVGLAYLRNDGPITSDWLASGAFSVDVSGDRFAIRPSLRAPT